jgi:amidase
MWGVPIVNKANTSIKGLVTTDGWKGYMIPGHELIAPKDATIVAKLQAAGAVARDVTDAAIALDVMAGPDPLNPRTADSVAMAERGPYTAYLKTDALKGKRFGVPAFILQGAGVPFQGIPAAAPASVVAAYRAASRTPLQPETREAFMKVLEGLRAAGATIVFDDSILPDSFAETVSQVCPFVTRSSWAAM